MARSLIQRDTFVLITKVTAGRIRGTYSIEIRRQRLGGDTLKTRHIQFGDTSAS